MRSLNFLLWAPFLFGVLCTAAKPDVKENVLDGQLFFVENFKNSPNVVALQSNGIRMSFDEGWTWKPVSELEGVTVDNLVMDPFVTTRAFAFTNSSKHFYTIDAGKTWRNFEVPVREVPMDRGIAYITVEFNSANQDYLIFGSRAQVLGHREDSNFYFTNNGLKSSPTAIAEGLENCVFPRSTKDYDSSVSPELLICSKNIYNSFGHVVSSELVQTTNFFKSQQTIDSPLTKDTEITSMVVHSSFLVVFSLKDRYSKSSYSLLVSKDAKTFNRPDVDFEKITDFGSERAWLTDVHSEASSLHFGVVHQGRTMVEDLYFSDASGLKFNKKLTAYAFTVKNYQAADGVWFADIGDSEGHFKSKYSIDDASTWHELEVIDSDCKLSDGCSLHLEVMNRFGGGILPATPNILIAVGTEGKFADHEKMWSDQDSEASTYLSRDGGRTWKLIFKEHSSYAYLDQGNVLVAFPFDPRKTSDTLHYSLNQGLDWETLKISTAVRYGFFFPSAGNKLLLQGEVGEESHLFSIDFSKIYNGKKCGSGDMEEIPVAVSPETKEVACVKGQSGVFSRRKPDSKCYVNADEPAVSYKPCACTAADFECSSFFKLSDKDACVPDYPKIVDECNKQNKKKVKLPHQQKASGNQCTLNKGADFVTETEFDCAQIKNEHGKETGNPINSKLSEIEGYLNQYSYVAVNNASSNILVHTSKNLVYASNDGGVSFVEVDTREKIEFFMAGAVPGTAVLVSEDNFYYSTNGGNTFTRFAAPGPPARYSEPFVFDPNDSQKFIYVTSNCKFGNKGCEAYFTENGGSSFSKMHDSIASCLYVDEPFGLDEDLVFCSVVDDSGVTLMSTNDYFRSSKKLLERVVAYAIRSKFVFVAVASEDMKTLEAKVTSDGSTFADAAFPKDFKMDVQSAYTLLNNNPYSILMHLTTDSHSGHERGAILKSNSNGTSYVLSLDNVNRDSKGYVDFDEVENLDGVMIANTVHNAGDSGPKKLKSKITFSDGSQWEYMVPPSVDSEGKKYACSGKPLAQCSLNLHGFTERPDYRDTFSSASAIGFLIGVGSVGETLESYDKCSTFFSSDGGFTWKEVAKGVYNWEFGDRGTILVLVRAVEAVKELLYSTDHGQSWMPYEFAELPVKVLDLATIPTDTSRKFIIFAEGKDRYKTSIYSIDFSNFYSRQCQLDLERPLEDDFEYWTPKHPNSVDDCLFGHEKQFLRRASGHFDCFIGAAPLVDGVKIVRNCTCTRDDYECDYNYFRDADGTCKLISGLSPQDKKKEMCAKPDAFEYFQPTGYRKIPLSTCVGGKALDAWDPQPCPGHEREFNKKYDRDVGFGKFLLILLIPLSVFIGATWFVYEKGVKRNGGFSRLGQIRLDDDGDFHPIEENGVDVAVNRIVRGGVLVAAGVVAVMKTVINTDRKILENAARILIGRRPGRRNYVRVPDDEDELFGEFDDNYEDELGDAAEVDFNMGASEEEFTDFTSNTEEADSRLFDIDDEESQAQSDGAETTPQPDQTQ